MRPSYTCCGKWCRFKFSRSCLIHSIGLFDKATLKCPVENVQDTVYFLKLFWEQFLTDKFIENLNQISKFNSTVRQNCGCPSTCSL